MIAPQRALLLGLIGLLFVGCSGGGRSGVPGVPGGTVSASNSSTKVTMLIPASIATQANGRKPQYVSPSTLGVAVWVFVPPATQPSTPTAIADFSASSPACTAGSNGSRTCTINIPAPVGSNVTFVVSTYDQTPSGGQPQGNVLSTNTLTGVVITAGQVNSVPLTLNGIAAALVLAPTAVQVPVGQSNSFTLDVNAKDVDGNYIIGTGSYTNPIALTTTGDPNHTISLSSASVTAPSGSAVTVTFNGGSLTAATITATATGATSASMTVTPSAAVSQVTFTIPGFSSEAVYAASANISVINRFASNANGSATPTLQLFGATALAVAVDGTNEYVLESNEFINVYPVEAGGGAPTRTIGGTNTLFCNPQGIAVYNGTLYVADGCAGILEWATTANGNVAPATQIYGANTGLTDPQSIAVNATGIYAGNRGANDTVVKFPLSAAGNQSPALTIAPGASSFDTQYGVQGVAVDAGGNVYVASDGNNNNVVVFAPGATTQSYAVTGGPSGVFCAPQGLALDGLGNLWVANDCPAGTGTNAEKLNAFAIGAGNATNAPVFSIGGPPVINFGPNGCCANIAVDPANNIYSANRMGYDVPQLNSSGTLLSSLATNPAGAISGPDQITFDSSGNLYAANNQLGSVSVYAPGASGEATPSRFFYPPYPSNIGCLDGVAVDAAGHEFVSNYCGTANALEEFPANASGIVSPMITLQGGATSGLEQPVQLAFDSSGNLYVASSGNNTIAIFGNGLLGNGVPTATIAGANTGLNRPTGVAVDPAGYVYVFNNGPVSVTVYGPGQTGNVAPLRVIAGSNTGLAGNNGLLTVDPFQNIYVAYGGGFSVFSAVANGNVAPNLRIFASGGVGGIAISPTQP